MALVGSRRARQAARDAPIARLPSSLPSLNVVTFQGLGHLILRERFGALRYAEPPEVLSAADQFALVQDLLQGQDPAEWPAYGHLLTLRGFADQIRQFVLRAQEAKITPEEVEARSEARGLTGWRELARFYREYLDVLDADRVVDFAAPIVRAEAAVEASGAPLFDHLLVDDYQDATFAQEALVRALDAADLVAAADPEAHVFSFQGTTAVPSLRFTETFDGGVHVELRVRHRAPREILDRRVERRPHVGGVRGDRPRAATSPRRGRCGVGGPRGRGPPTGLARRRAPPRARRRTDPAWRRRAACRSPRSRPHGPTCWRCAGSWPARTNGTDSSSRSSCRIWSGCRRRRRAASCVSRTSGRDR